MTKGLRRFGIVFVVSGPSGTGKSTICRKVLQDDSNLKFSVSCTTRPPREGENDGVDYYFISKNKFRDHIKQNAFIEHAEVHEELYGTLRSEVEDCIKIGRDILLDIDVQGVARIQGQEEEELWTQCVQYIFFAPPSLGELERRLRGRGTESETRILSRLNAGDLEMKNWKNYNYLLINFNISDSVKKLQSIIQAERLKTSRIINKEPWKS